MNKITLITFCLILLSIFIHTGCGGDTVVIPVNTPLNTPVPQGEWAFDGKSSDYFSEIIDSFKDTKKSEIADIVVGALIEFVLLPDKSDEILEKIVKIKETTVGIQEQLINVNNQITDISNRLDFQVNAVLLSIEEGTVKTPIDTIRSHYEEGGPDSLSYYTRINPQQVSSGQKRAANKLVENIRGQWDIVAKVEAIYSAIDKENGLLDLFTNQLIMKYKNNPDKAELCYKALEAYFTRLIYIQLEGATLYIEAVNVRKKDNQASARDYINNTFMPYIRKELTVFKRCSEKLLFNMAKIDENLYNSEISRNKPFITDQFTPALARAHFLYQQVSGEKKFGLKGIIMATEDYSPYINGITVKGGGNLPVSNERSLVTGSVYAAWKDSASVEPSDKWVVYEIDFESTSFNPGSEYEIALLNPSNNTYINVGTVKINNYDENYNQGSGTIPYGYFALIWRWGSNKFERNTNNWQVTKDVQINGTPKSFTSNPDQNGSWNPQEPMNILISSNYINSEYGAYQRFNIDLQASRSFTFKGTGDTPGNIYYRNVSASGNVEVSELLQTSCSISVTDTTRNETVYIINKTTDYSNRIYKFNENINLGKCDITFKNGHTYKLSGKVYSYMGSDYENTNEVKLNWENIQLVF